MGRLVPRKAGLIVKVRGHWVELLHMRHFYVRRMHPRAYQAEGCSDVRLFCRIVNLPSFARSLVGSHSVTIFSHPTLYPTGEAG